MSNVGVTLTPEQVKRIRLALYAALNACDISIHRPTKRAERIAGDAIDAIREVSTMLDRAGAIDEVRNGWEVDGNQARYIDARGRWQIQIDTVDDHPEGKEDGPPVFYICAGRPSLIDPRASNAFFLVQR